MRTPAPLTVQGWRPQHLHCTGEDDVGDGLRLGRQLYGRAGHAARVGEALSRALAGEPTVGGKGSAMVEREGHTHHLNHTHTHHLHQTHTA